MLLFPAMKPEEGQARVVGPPAAKAVLPPSLVRFLFQGLGFRV